MANLGTLTLDLVARIGGFTGPLDKAGRESKKFLDSLEKGAKRAGAAIGTASVVAAGAVALFVKNSIDEADAASKAAQATGLTVEAFTGLSYAAKLADLDTEALKKGMSRLNVAIGEASTGSKEQASLFKAMGVSIKDASGNLRTGDEVLKDLAEKFASMPDGVDKSATAIKIFGKAGADMIPFLNAGKDGIQEMITEAEALGLVLTTTQAQASEQFNDSLTTLGQVTKGAANNVSKALLPALNSLTGMMIDVAKDTGTASEFGNILAGVLKFVASTALGGATAIMNIGRAIGGVAAAGSFALEGEFKLAYQTIKAIGVENRAATAITDERIKRLMGADYETAGKKAARVVNILGAASKIAAEKVGEVATKTKEHTGAIEKQIAALQLQLDTFGMSETEAKLWGMSTDGVTGKLFDNAEAILAQIDALKKQKTDQEEITANLKNYQSLLNDLRTDEEKYTDTVQERLDIIAKAGKMPTAEEAAKIVGSGVTSAPTFGGVDAVVGGASGEIGKIDAAQAELDRWYETEMKKQEKNQEFRDAETEIFKAAEEKKYAIFEEYLAKKNALEKTRLKTQEDQNLAAMQGEIAIYTAVAESMTGIVKNLAGENSAAYKAMFAVEKIAAAAMIIVNTHVAASNARKTSGSFLSGEILANMVMIAGYAQAGMVAGMGLAGMAHDGIDSIPQDGTWLLKKGERVSTAETSAKLDRTLESVSKQSTGGDAPIVNLYEDKSKAGQVETRQQDDRRVIDIWVADLMGDGKAQKAMSRKFGLQPVGA